jgi:pyruvate/2-oxoglutarate/acetoin dehydrogenase E1 component
MPNQRRNRPEATRRTARDDRAVAAIRDDDPVIYTDHRLLHFQNGPVPETLYTVEPGRARVTVQGDDVTLVGVSQMLTECLGAQTYLQAVGINAEVIDPIWLKPLDKVSIGL